jgi:hypothetical protein
MLSVCVLCTCVCVHCTCDCTPGGIECILVVMLAHPADQQVVVEACRSLVNLSGTDDNTGKVVTGGGIEYITGSMHRIPENVELQLLSCWCLMHLTNPLYNFHQLASRAKIQATDQMFIDQMVKAGTVERTISVLRSHTGVKLW